MSNIFAKIGSGIKTVGEDLVKGVEWLPEHLLQVAEVLGQVIKDSPTVQAELKTLIGKVDAVSALIGSDVAEKGLSLPDDLNTIHAIQDLVTYLTGTFFVTISQEYKVIKGDLATPVQTAPATTAS